MTSLAIYLLGPFHVHIDGQPVTDQFRTEKERALLAYLAVQSQRAHSREALGELLWPERPEGGARTNLRQALSGVRRVINNNRSSPPFLEVTNKTIRFNPDSECWLDSEAFLDHLNFTKIHAHNILEHCPECVERLQKAIALYKGEFLTDFYSDQSLSFKEWLAFLREQYARQYLGALHSLSEYFKYLGNYDKAIGFARQEVNYDPLEESAHRQLMALLALSGNRNAAVEQYQNCNKIFLEELGVEPSRETVDLYEKIKTGLQFKTHRSNLLTSRSPTQLTSFIDRENHLARFKNCLVNPVCRLMTIVGIAGVGKTRFILHAANQYMSELPDGVWYVHLEQVAAPELLVPSIAQALGLQLRGSHEPLDQLIDHLSPLKTLLVLDHFDHLLSEIGTLLEIIRLAPGVRIAITSRERIDYQAACLYDIQGLAYPPSGNAEDIYSYPACQLFVARGLRLRSGFKADEAEAPHIARICQLVEGHPLAIELAAARLRELTCAEIAASLEYSFDLLEVSYKDVPERHRSLRKALDQSWLLLNDQEKEVYCRLAGCEGEFSQETAEKDCGATPEILSSLQNKSLIRRTSVGTITLPAVSQYYALIKRAEREEGELPTELEMRPSSSRLYDSLTKLPGLDLFWDRLSYVLASARRNKTQFAIIMLDLDQFDQLGVEQGKKVGDHLLEILADSLRSQLRGNDNIARLGQSRFGFILEGISNKEKATIVGEKIMSIIRNAGQVSGQARLVSGSLGISLYPDDGIAEQTLVRKAWIAMENAQRTGNCCLFYSQGTAEPQME